MNRNPLFARTSRPEILLQQIADGISSGMKAPDVIRILTKARDGSRDAQQTLSAWAELLGQGQSVASIFALYPRLFPPEASEFIRFAEERSATADAMRLIAHDLELRSNFRLGLRGVLGWPMFTAAITVLVMAVAMIFVMPVYKDLFKSFGADLPLPTLVLITISDWLVAGGWLVAVAFVVFGVWLSRQVRRGRQPAWFDTLLMRVPHLREYTAAVFAMRLARVLQQGLDEKTAHALAYLRASAGNHQLRQALAIVESDLRSGKDLASSLWSADRMPSSIAIAAEIGERTGALPAAMERLAESAQADATRHLAQLQRAALASLYVVLAVTVGAFVIALYLPIFKMGEAV